MKKGVLFLCLITAVIMHLPVLAEEDPTEAAITEGVTDIFNCYAAKDIDGMLKWVSPYSTQLIAELRNEVKNIQNIKEFSCGNLNLIRYKYKDGDRVLKVELTFECSGFDPETSKEFKREMAKQALIIRDEEGSYKITQLRDFDVNVDRAVRPLFEKYEE